MTAGSPEDRCCNLEEVVPGFFIRIKAQSSPALQCAARPYPSRAAAVTAPASTGSKGFVHTSSWKGPFILVGLPFPSGFTGKAQFSRWGYAMAGVCAAELVPSKRSGGTRPQSRLLTGLGMRSWPVVRGQIQLQIRSPSRFCCSGSEDGPCR